MEEQKEEKNKDQKTNSRRSPFSKLENKNKNYHSLDADREEIAEGDPLRDLIDEERLQRQPWEEKKPLRRDKDK